jgi:hypothetical protein
VKFKLPFPLNNALFKGEKVGLLFGNGGFPRENSPFPRGNLTNKLLVLLRKREREKKY